MSSTSDILVIYLSGLFMGILVTCTNKIIENSLTGQIDKQATLLLEYKVRRKNAVLEIWSVSYSTYFNTCENCHRITSDLGLVSINSSMLLKCYKLIELFIVN